MIKFLNEPELSIHEIDSKFNDRRISLVPKIQDLISNHPLFTNKDVEISFIHRGVSSLVSILSVEDKKFILKIPLSIIDSRQEGSFLMAWEKIGIKVPRVIEEGSIGDHYYIIMEYVNALTLSKTYNIDELLENNIYTKLGEMLKKMHSVKAKGYGMVVNNTGEFKNFSAWIENSKITDKINYVKEHGLLQDEHGSIDEAISLIISRIENEEESVYGHNDFHIGNLFSTEPFTVFDPIPLFCHPYSDVARSIIIASKMGLEKVSEQFLNGYFRDENFDRQLLQAFIILNVYDKFKYRHQKNEIKDMEDIKTYLVKTKHYLE